MKRKLGAVITILMVLGLILSGCSSATPTAVPQATQAVEPTKAVEPTSAPAKAETIKVIIATDAAFPPMEFVDASKNITGFDIDMLNAIAKVEGFEVEYKNTAWDGIFSGLESGDYDAIISSVTITEKRQETYDFSDPYINAGQIVTVLVDNTDIKSDKDLSGKVVGAQIGTTGALVVQEMPNVTLKEYDNIDLAFLDLANRNVDAVVVDTPVAADYALASDQFKGKLKIVGDPFTEEYYGLVVKKGAMQDLLKLFNDGLKKIQADGTYDKIYAKWISGGEMTAPVASEAAKAPIAPPPGFPITIALITPLSGEVKTFGESVRNSTLLVLEEAKAAGWDINLIVEDGKCDPQEASNAANKVIFEDHVHYIIGEVCSGSSIPVSEIAEANGVVQISGTATSPMLTVNEDGSTKQYVFRGCFIDPFQGRVMATLARDDLSAKTAAVLYDVGNDYTVGLAEYFKAAFEEQGGTVSVYETYTKDDTDFSAILGKVAAAGVDVIFLPDYYAKNNLIANQIKEKGIKATLLGADGWDSSDLQLDLFEGGYFSNHYHPDDPRPILQNFISTYRAKYGATPDALATLGYDAAKILLQAISEAGVDDPAVVKDKMAAIKYEGLAGSIFYDEQHNPVKSAAIVKIENGQLTFYKAVAP